MTFPSRAMSSESSPNELGSGRHVHCDFAVGDRRYARSAQQIDQINFSPLTGNMHSLGLVAPEHEGLQVAVSCDSDLLNVFRQSGQVIEQRTTIKEMAGHVDCVVGRQRVAEQVAEPQAGRVVVQGHIGL